MQKPPLFSQTMCIATRTVHTHKKIKYVIMSMMEKIRHVVKKTNMIEMAASDHSE